MNKFKIVLSLILGFLIITPQVFSQELEFNWAQQYGSPNSSNDLQALASDNQNNVFAFTHFNGEFTVDGNTFITQGGEDLLLYSINEDGQVGWVVTEGGEDNEYAQKIACDDDGNVYIIGKFSGSLNMNGVEYISNGSFDMFMAKYSNSGEFLWCKILGGPNSESLVSMKIKNNRIVLAGRFYNYTVIQEDTLYSYSGTDSFISKFDLDGQLLNSVTIGGESVDMISSLAIDDNSNIYVTGDFYSDIYIGEDIYFNADDLLGIFVAKFDASLNLVWAFQPIGDDLKPGVKLDVSSNGVCTLTGSFISSVQFDNIQLNTSPADEDIYMVSFHEDGTVDWAQRFHSNSTENIVDIGVDQSGDIYIAGHYLGDINFNGLILNYSLC